MSARRIALLTMGTRDDLQPALAIAGELARRGHEVVLTVPAESADWAAPSGVDVIPFDSHSDAFDGVADAMLAAVEHADVIASTELASDRATVIAEATGLPHGVLGIAPDSMRDEPDHARIIAALSARLGVPVPTARPRAQFVSSPEQAADLIEAWARAGISTVGIDQKVRSS